LGGNENAPFQYIVSTTTPPPEEMKPLIRLELASYPEGKLLFKKQLHGNTYGRDGELALAEGQDGRP